MYVTEVSAIKTKNIFPNSKKLDRRKGAFRYDATSEGGGGNGKADVAREVAKN